MSAVAHKFVVGKSYYITHKGEERLVRIEHVGRCKKTGRPYIIVEKFDRDASGGKPQYRTYLLENVTVQ